HSSPLDHGARGLARLLRAQARRAPRARSWLASERVSRVTTLVTVALLVSLVVVQGFADGRTLVVDARVPALAVAALALALRAPFILVVLLAAATAAGLRALGWG